MSRPAVAQLPDWSAYGTPQEQTQFRRELLSCYGLKFHAQYGNSCCYRCMSETGHRTSSRTRPNARDLVLYHQSIKHTTLGQWDAYRSKPCPHYLTKSTVYLPIMMRHSVYALATALALGVAAPVHHLKRGGTILEQYDFIIAGGKRSKV